MSLSRVASQVCSKRGLIGQGVHDYLVVSPAGARSPGHASSFAAMNVYALLVRGAQRFGLAAATASQSLALPLAFVHPPVNLILDHATNAWETVGMLAVRALARIDLYQARIQVRFKHRPRVCV